MYHTFHSLTRQDGILDTMNGNFTSPLSPQIRKLCESGVFLDQVARWHPLLGEWGVRGGRVSVYSVQDFGTCCFSGDTLNRFHKIQIANCQLLVFKFENHFLGCVKVMFKKKYYLCCPLPGEGLKVSCETWYLLSLKMDKKQGFRWQL